MTVGSSVDMLMATMALTIQLFVFMELTIKQVIAYSFRSMLELYVFKTLSK